MRIHDIVDTVTRALEAFDPTSYVEVGYSNWEPDWSREGEEFRNYRNNDEASVHRVIEHATRRGDNVELVLRVQVGTVARFPEDIADAKADLARREEIARIRSEAAVEAERVRAEAEARIAALMGQD